MSNFISYINYHYSFVNPADTKYCLMKYMIGIIVIFGLYNA